MSTPLVAPNHHAHHPGFSGPKGAFAAVAFLFGRRGAAELALRLAELEPGDRLVDIGCGPGIAARHANKLGAEVVGVDPAGVMLRVARTRWLGTGIAWRVGTAESIPVDDGWADAVWSLATVHHWFDLDAGIEEAKRVLKPGGRLVALERKIADPDADGVASHGWTVRQAETFAEMCRDHGFAEATTAVHEGSPTIVSATCRLGSDPE